MHEDVTDFDAAARVWVVQMFIALVKRVDYITPPAN